MDTLKTAIDNNDVSLLKKILARNEHNGLVVLSPNEAATVQITHNERTETGALHYAAMTNRNPVIYQMLLDCKKYAFNLRDNFSRYPLHYFIFYEKHTSNGYVPNRRYDHSANVDCFCLLLQDAHGRSLINTQDMLGKTPLHYVCDVAHYQYIGVFTTSVAGIESANTGIPDVYGWNPLQCLMYSTRIKFMAGKPIEKDALTAKLVRAYFASCTSPELKRAIINHPASNRKSALQMAHEQGFSITVQELLNV